MNAIPRQLPLALGFSERFGREDFLAGPSNEAALALVERWPDWPSPAVALVGPEGAGKSHLAAVWAKSSGARSIASAAITLAGAPTALATGALVIEDLREEGLREEDLRAEGLREGSCEDTALFHLLNLAREQGAFLLVTARTPPSSWAVRLRDLASRLRALPVVTLAPPDDALLRAVLVKQFADRHLDVDEDVIGYLTTRIERSFAGARAIVAEIDHEALRRQKRKVNRALAADLLRGAAP